MAAETDTVTIPRALYEETLAKLRAVAAEQAERSAVTQLREQIDRIYARDAVERGAIFLVNNYPRQAGGRFGFGPGVGAHTSGGSSRTGQGGGNGGQNAGRAGRARRRSSGAGAGSSRSQTTAERELEAAKAAHEQARNEVGQRRQDAEVAGRHSLAAQEALRQAHTGADSEARQREIEAGRTRNPSEYARYQRLQQRAAAAHAELDAQYAEGERQQHDLARIGEESRAQGINYTQHPEYQQTWDKWMAHSTELEAAWIRADRADRAARASADRLVGNRVIERAEGDVRAAGEAHQAAIDRYSEASRREQNAALRVGKAEGMVDLERGGTGVQMHLSADSQKTADDVFGRHVSEDDLVRLSGARVGDSIEIERDGDQSLRVHVGGSIERDFQVSRVGSDVVLHDHYTENHGEKTASSGHDLITGMQSMREMGVTKVVCIAGRSSSMNGYYTWARLGFHGKIPGDVLHSARAQFGEKISRVEQIMAKPGGAQWWKQHGQSWEASFSFRSRSSMAQLNRLQRIVGRHDTKEGK